MKSLVIIGVLFFAALVSAETVAYPRGCIYILGRCHKECPVGTHAYALGCGHKTPEPTCREPQPQPETGMLCDYSACYCDAPAVRDETTNTCVKLEDCPPQKPNDDSELTEQAKPEPTVQAKPEPTVQAKPEPTEQAKS